MTLSGPRSTRRSTSVRLELTAQVGRRYVPSLRKGLGGALEMIHAPLRELSIALVGDSAMSELHQRFMGISGPTDVLTFPLDCDEKGLPQSGEIIVCVPYAQRQARLRGIQVDRELLLYALHGTLHLAGFDDKTESGFRRMHRKEDQILTALGVGPVFAPANPPDTRPRSRGAR
jgi:rRNA maturation RNase YbeY